MRTNHATTAFFVFFGLIGLSLLSACEGEESSAASTASSSSSSSSSGGQGGSGGGMASYPIVTVQGFDWPESIIWDAANQLWYVSNMSVLNPDISQKDGSGFISQVDTNGKIVQSKWVDGLDTPAGMAIVNGKLYVANIDELGVIDIATGTLTKIPAPGALLLNDIAAIGNELYVTDTFGHAIFHYKEGDAMLTEFSKDPKLDGPNGIFADTTGNRLIVACLHDFATETPGPMLSIDLTTKSVQTFGTLTGKFDGIEKHGDAFFVSENPTSYLYRFEADGSYKLVYDLHNDHGVMSAADLGYDPATAILGIADMQHGAVHFIGLKGQ